MFKDRDDKWTRKRGFLEVNGGDFLMVGVALFFLTLTVCGFYVIIVQPQIKGLHELFSDPPPPPPPLDQKLHLAPGEQEIILFKKPVPAPKPDAKK